MSSVVVSVRAPISLVIIVTLAVAGVWLVVGCLGGSAELPLGAVCTSSDECAGSLVCVVGRCRSECLFDRDCPEGQVCFASSTLPNEQVCTFGDEGVGGVVDCPEDLVRPEPDGACRQTCMTNFDCGDDRLCVEEFCWDTGEEPDVDAGYDDADVMTGDHDADEPKPDDAGDADVESEGDVGDEVDGDGGDGADGDGADEGVIHEACADNSLAWQIYPGGDMVECEGNDVEGNQNIVNQCEAERNRCNVDGGWHLCTGSEYLARGGADIPGREAWLRSCLRTNHEGPFAPTDDYCANCNQVWADELPVAWECGSGAQAYDWATSFNEEGVVSYSSCRRIGVNAPANEAYWDALPTFDRILGALCCSQ